MLLLALSRHRYRVIIPPTFFAPLLFEENDEELSRSPQSI